VHNVHEHAAVLHLRLLRPQTMLRFANLNSAVLLVPAPYSVLDRVVILIVHTLSTLSQLMPNRVLI
jgi:hypothetical protein